MDGFLIQFLAQAWRLIAIIIGLILLAIFVAWRNSKKKQDEIQYPMKGYTRKMK